MSRKIVLLTGTSAFFVLAAIGAEMMVSHPIAGQKPLIQAEQAPGAIWQEWRRAVAANASETNAIGKSTLPLPKLQIVTTNFSPRPSAGGGHGISAQLEPGLYQAQPYSGIVIVPRQHLDDKMVTGLAMQGSTNTFPIKIIRPELGLIRRPQSK